jgi:hypothetical protein
MVAKSMSHWNHYLIAIAAWAGFCLPASAQTAELSGMVRDSSSAVLASARITAINQSNGLSRSTLSNRLGYYSISFLQPGNYDIQVQMSGFKTLRQSGIRLGVGEVSRLDFTLQIATRSEVITVRGDSISLQNESAAVGTTVDRKFVSDLPLNGRTFQSLIALVPGVVPSPGDGQFNVNGQRDDGNYFTVDGVSANTGISSLRTLQETAGGTVPAFNVFGATSNLVSVDAMQEFRIQTSTYAAEFGRAPGGQVQIVTRSGTNEFHGTAFDYFRNDALDANDWFANNEGLPRSPLRQNDFGAVFGGPVLKDKTFFFASYEGLRLRQPKFAQITVPSLSARTLAPAPVDQLLKAFPLPNGPENPITTTAQFSASYSEPISLDAGSMRVDHKLTDRLTVFGRFSEARSAALTRVDALVHVRLDDVDTSSLTLGATLSATPAITNEFRANYTRNGSSHFNKLDDFGGAVPPPDSLLFSAPFASPRSSRFIFFEFADNLRYVSGRSSDHVQRQLNVVDGVSMVRGSHALKFGVDYRHLTPIFGPQDYGLQIGYRTLLDAVAGQPPIAGIAVFDRIDFSFHNLSLYSQDTWRPTSRLTLSYGLRWELNPLPTSTNGQQLYTLSGINDLSTARAAPAGTPLYRTTYTNFAPRLGVAYQASQEPGRETVIRGGFGVFYDLGSGVIGETAQSFPHFRRRTVTGVPFPLGGAAAPPSLPSLDPPYSGQTFLVFDPDIAMPRTYQWNLALQQSLGAAQVISASYVGAAGRELLFRATQLGSAPNFINSSLIDLTANRATSDYHALQLGFQRQLSRGLQILTAYTWSHSIDIASSNGLTQIPAQHVRPELNRGPSDFDVRHSFRAAAIYEVPRLQGWTGMMFRHWLIGAILAGENIHTGGCHCHEAAWSRYLPDSP